MEENTNKEEQTQENEQPEATGVDAFFRNKWKAVAGRFGKSRKSEKEAETKENEQLNAAEMIATFNRGWETVVELVVRMTGLGKSAARNAILVAIVPLLTAAVQIMNWLYLYVHYHLGYNVPMAYLTVDTSWLMSFGSGVFLAVIVAGVGVVIGYFASCSTRARAFRWVVAFLMLAGLLLIVLFVFAGPNWAEFSGWLLGGLIWLLFAVCIIAPIFGRKSGKWTGIKKQLAIVITVVLDALVILLLCIWWGRWFLADFWPKWDLAKFIGLNVWLWAVISLFVYEHVITWVLGMVKHSVLRKGALRVQIGLLFVATIFVFFLWDDTISRASPYAVTANSEQVVVYQSKEISVLEAATIENKEVVGLDDETSAVALTIDTSQQQIVDSTSVSYEYQTFDTVEIIATSDENGASTYSKKQMQETIEAAFNKLANLFGLETSTSADTSTDPADGAASYDTSN